MQRTGIVLIVEREPQIVDLLVELLTDEGYIVVAAVDNASASSIIINCTPALLLLDMWMPGITGSVLLAQLRAAAVVAMPIVLMTTEPLDVEQLLVPGAVMCLAKPFDIEDVLTCVARYVQPHEHPMWRGAAPGPQVAALN